MERSPAIERIREMARAILEFEGMELVHLEMKPGPQGWFLRLFIDRDGGVSLDDCSRVSRQLSAQLDVEEPIEHRYTLEVSSPGLDRPLYSDGDFARFAGREVRVSTYAPFEGRRRFSGRLNGLINGAVHLVLDGEREIAIPRSQIASAKLEPQLPGSRAGGGGKGRNA